MRVLRRARLVRRFGLMQFFRQARDLGFEPRDRVRRTGNARVQLGLEPGEVVQCALFARGLRAVLRDGGLLRRGLRCRCGDRAVERRLRFAQLIHSLCILVEFMPDCRLARGAVRQRVGVALLRRGEVVPLEQQAVVGALQAIHQRLVLRRGSRKPRLFLRRAAVLRLDGLEVVIERRQFFLRFVECPLGFCLRRFAPMRLRFRFLQPPRARQRARPARGRAAGHRAAGLDDLSVERDDAEAVSIRLRDGERRVHVLRDDRPREQIFDDGVVAPLYRDEPVRRAEAAALVFQPGLAQRRRADGVDRQEGRAAAVRALEVFDAALAVRRRIHHDAGRGRAERRVDRGDEAFLRRDERGHRAVDAAERLALDRAHHALDRAREALVVALHIAQHLLATARFGQRCVRAVQLVLQSLDLAAAALRLEGDARQLVLRAGKRLQTLLQTGFQLVLRLFFGVQAVFRLLYVLRDGVAARIHAVQPGLRRRAVQLEGVQRVALFGERPLGLLQRRCVLRALRLLLPGFSGQLIQRRRQSFVLRFQQSDARAVFRQLSPQTVRLFGALRALAAGAVDVLPVVLYVRLQHGRAARLFGGALLDRAQVGAQAVGLAVDPAHFLEKLLGAGVQSLLRRFCFAELTAAGHRILRGLGRVGLDALERQQPQRDLQHAQLVAQEQVLLCLFRLLFQRADLARQLVVQIADAGQIVLGRGQLALGLLLAVAELGDARRFLEDLAPVLALEGQYLVDTALSDAGIAVPPEAGIHEQLVDVTQAAVLFVQVIFTLARTVIAARDHDLGEFRAKNTLGIVEDERHLGKADRAALRRAAEDDVLHLCAAQRPRGLLAQHPADGVRNIRFARAVRPDDRRYAAEKPYLGPVGKRLEALQDEAF